MMLIKIFIVFVTAATGILIGWSAAGIILWDARVERNEPMAFIRIASTILAGAVAFMVVIWLAYLALLAASSGNLY